MNRRCYAQYDTHELLKKEIYSQGKPASNPHTEDAGPQITGIEDYEFYLDSINRDTSSQISNGQLNFSITAMNNGFQEITNIIEIRVGSFYFPKIASNGSADFFYYRRAFLQVANISSTSSIVAANGERIHFEFEVDNLTSTAVRFTPTKEVYYLQRPFLSISDLQLVFTVPVGFQHIPIPNDNVSVVSVPASNPAEFVIQGVDTTAVLGPIGPLPVPGVAVFFSGFNSGTGLDATVNAQNGIFAITVLSATNFTIAANFAALALGFPAKMIIGKNRIAFPMRFTTVKNMPTNYVVPAHF